ncbi:hypothetical protein [Enhygromyxa salina]|uniref:hypothetical protein n=1 Tax=Enhygromyxa salina TaxID=215803 RepID=UPI000D094FC6|nr:hypothetical protein [Enhygromyxa salina]
MAATASRAAPGNSATAPPATCARCGEPFAGPEDRRAQLRAPDLCRACHLDPRARSLPLETEIGKSWVIRCAKTLLRLITSPSACFRVVEEPVSHARILAFLATLRLPLWLLALGWAGIAGLLADGPGPLKRPSILVELLAAASPGPGDAPLGAQTADVLRLWLLLLVPVGLPMLYFFGGVLAHMGMALTGGARRSIGATMRAVGLALAPSLTLVAISDLLVVGVGVEPEIWIVLLGVAALLGAVLLALALARTHSTSLIRGLLVAGLPAVLFASIMIGRGLLEYYRLPFMPAPEIESYAPYPIR